jgi:hypothetical protein
MVSLMASKSGSKSENISNMVKQALQIFIILKLLAKWRKYVLLLQPMTFVMSLIWMKLVSLEAYS